MTGDGIYKVDVSNQKSQKDIDLMAPKTFQQLLRKDVDLTFVHQLVKLDLSVSVQDLPTVEIGKVTVNITNQKYKADFKVRPFQAELLSRLTPADGLLNLELLNKENGKYEGIVLPAASLEDMQLEFTDGTRTWNWNITTDSGKFESGHKYTYNITLTPTSINVSSSDIKNWTSDADDLKDITIGHE